MESSETETTLERERLVFFSDAVIAIAITLLALELKIEPEGPHFTFNDLFRAWHSFAAFFLSFIIIAVFWINHHRFFVHIKATDARILSYNMGWLLFIVLLPFSSSLISDDFFNKPAMFVYSINVLLVSYFQNAIWDHTVAHPALQKSTLTATIEREYRVGCNLAMGNAFFAIVIAFFSPPIAFLTLVTRTFMFRRSAQQHVARLTQRRLVKDKMLEQRKESATKHTRETPPSSKL